MNGWPFVDQFENNFADKNRQIGDFDSILKTKIDRTIGFEEKRHFCRIKYM
jgi:hypothetical protein